MSDGYRWTPDDLKRHLGKLKHLSPVAPKLSSEWDDRRVIATPKPRKYRNTPVLRVFDQAEIVNGHLRLCHTFDSIREADYYSELVIRRQAGEIKDLRLQEPFALVIRTQDGKDAIVGEWRADAVFTDFTLDARGARVVADAKGVRTPVYQLKKKIVEAYWQITILEV